MGGQAAGQFLRPEDGRFVDGALTVAGMEPLPLARLAANAHAMGLVTAAMVHGFNRWSWAVAVFEILGQRWEAPIDALAVRCRRDHTRPTTTLRACRRCCRCGSTQTGHHATTPGVDRVRRRPEATVRRLDGSRDLVLSLAEGEVVAAGRTGC